MLSKSTNRTNETYVEHGKEHFYYNDDDDDYDFRIPRVAIRSSNGFKISDLIRQVSSKT